MANIKLIDLKIIIPLLITIIGSSFTGGIYVRGQLANVEVAKVNLQLEECNIHNNDMKKLIEDSSGDRDQLIALSAYTKYLLSVIHYNKHGNDKVFDTAIMQKQTFLNYSKKFIKADNLDIDGVIFPIIEIKKKDK